MQSHITRIAITGGAGQIAYNLLFRIASGEMLGPNQQIALHILEIPEVLPALEGVKMELEDCAFPLLKEIIIGSDPESVFKGVHFALLIGSTPRGPGMERIDLLKENGKIFIQQGKALDAVADKNVKVLVVGNPCNTNALIAMTYAPSIPRKNFFSMTRLDQNRAMAQLALKSKKDVKSITNMTIWGNHSSTQVPDFYHAEIDGQDVESVIKDKHWLVNEFIPAVQKRGAAIIATRGKSSAASAANAVIDTIKSLITKTAHNDSFSVGLCSDSNTYGIEKNLIFSFPCRVTQSGDVEIIDTISINSDLYERIKLSEKELIEERELALKNCS